MNLSELTQRIADIESRLTEVENYRNPRGVEGRIEVLFGEVEKLTTTLSLITQKLVAMRLEDRFIEICTDEELKDWYVKSGIATPETKAFIEKNFNEGKEVDLATVSRYVNGQIKDLRVRSALLKLFRENALRNQDSETKG